MNPITQAQIFRFAQNDGEGKRAPVPLGKSLDTLMGDFWPIINNVAKEPSAYVMTPEEVKRLALKRDKNGSLSYWLQLRAYDAPEYKEAWHRIGFGH